jgi:hypothetical protein
MNAPYEDQNSTFRTLFRIGAMIMIPVGAIFLLIGLIDFFGAFSGHGFPTKFWCTFVGIPLLAFGTFCFKAGFLRTITGYVAGEAAPAIRDTAAFVAEGLRADVGAAPYRLHNENNPVERMKKLDELRKHGLISQSEYSLKRESILKEI